ncbi:WD40-repeat-containing domain protein [Chlamydoabsidia padenii]|nr:WD40-repeat-containing domain protein [Chlamydoabsidia padenii]
MNDTVDGFSKETRKLRKKKNLSDNESEHFQPINRSHMKIKEQPKRTMSTRASSSSSFPSISGRSYAAVATINIPKMEARKEYVMTPSSDNNSASPGTPLPQSPPPPALEESLEDSDSVDGYDTDDLLEKVDQLGPLRKALPPQPISSRQNKAAKNNKGKKRAGKKKNTQQTRQKKKNTGKQPLVQQYDHERTQSLASSYPDTYWKFDPQNSNMVGNVNSSEPLVAVHSMTDQGPVLGMELSEDGMLLATFCTMGTIKIWDIQNDFSLLRTLRDEEETHIDEYYCGLFKEGYLLAAGKLKDRRKWSYEDDDCHILPCPIKIFDLTDCKVSGLLEGHDEEILCIKSLRFDNENYYISTSQDGYIIKWHVAADWTTLHEFTRMDDGITCMAFTVSFIPNTGNKYFLGACDAHLRLYDFEHAQLLQTFEGLYSSYCDCGKFINWLDEKYYLAQKEAACMETSFDGKKRRRIKDDEEEESELVDIEDDDDTIPDLENETYAWVITRGAEMVDAGEVASLPNTCALHKLIYPKETGGKFVLEEIKRYEHDKYHANSWLVKIASNGRYLFAPTMDGQIFVFNILTGHATAIMKDHQDIEVRDIVLHPYLPLLFSSGDDGCVNIYTYKDD